MLGMYSCDPDVYDEQMANNPASTSGSPTNCSKVQIYYQDNSFLFVFFVFFEGGGGGGAWGFVVQRLDGRESGFKRDRR